MAYEDARSSVDGLTVKVKRSDIVYRHMHDPALMKRYYSMRMLPIMDRMELSGSSPTDVFIGSYNYPNVFIGPMVPPEFGDTSLLGTPERWRSFSIPKIVEMRSRLVRGMYQSNVKSVENGRVEEQVRDLALAERPAEAEVDFAKRPFVSMQLNDDSQPFGPSVRFKGLEVYNTKADRDIERLYSDTDAKASTAILELYDRDLPVSKIQQALSAGTLGIGGRRRFVPTRWSITAVDDTIGKSNLERVKEYDSVDAIYAFHHVSLDNRWLIFFMPGNWEYESAEAWYPDTIWNQGGGEVSIYSSYEGYYGRKTYAEIGGCYYAAKVAVTERLMAMKRQAKVMILREVHSGYLLPVGVWNVREHVRETLSKEPHVMHTAAELFEYVNSKMEITNRDWIANCRILRDMLAQPRLSEYVAGRPLRPG